MKVRVQPCQSFAYKGINYNAGDELDIDIDKYDEVILKKLDKPKKKSTKKED